jgi:RNA polymerase sigma factor (sigma-70 family)
MNAIDRFDPARGNRFTRYLMPFLRGAIAGMWKDKNVVTPSSHSDKFPGFQTYKEDSHDDSGDCRKMQKHVAELSASTDELVIEKEEAKLNLALLKKCKCKLTAAEKELLRLIYDEGVSMADIARQRKVSRQAIHAAHGQIVAKLRAGFKRNSK